MILLWLELFGGISVLLGWSRLVADLATSDKSRNHWIALVLFVMELATAMTAAIWLVTKP